MTDRQTDRQINRISTYRLAPRKGSSKNWYQVTTFIFLKNIMKIDKNLNSDMLICSNQLCPWMLCIRYSSCYNKVSKKQNICSLSKTNFRIFRNLISTKTNRFKSFKMFFYDHSIKTCYYHSHWISIYNFFLLVLNIMSLVLTEKKETFNE